MIELDIHPRAEISENTRIQNGSPIGHDIQTGIDHVCIDEIGAIDIAALEVKEKRNPLA